MRKLGLECEHWMEDLSDKWTEIVGEAVAAHTRPGRIEARVLYVFVDSSVWLNELKRYGAKSISGNLKRCFGEKRIKDVRFQLDPDG